MASVSHFSVTFHTKNRTVFLFTMSDNNTIVCQVIVLAGSYQQYSLRHSNIVLSLVLSTHMISLTSKNTYTIAMAGRLVFEICK